MGTAENQQLVRRFFEESINTKNLAAVDDVIGPTYVNHDMPTPGPGPEGMRAVLQMFFAAFSDMNVVVEQTLGEGDLVATRGRFEGTHDGEFMGVPATGKSVSVKYIDMWRLEGGKAVENWVQLDMLGLMQQLGVVPGP